MIDNGAEVAEDWTWLQTSGYAMRFQQVPAKAAVAISNSFAALTSEEPAADEGNCGEAELTRRTHLDGLASKVEADHVPCAAAPDPVASVLQRTGRQVCQASGSLTQVRWAHGEPLQTCVLH